MNVDLGVCHQMRETCLLEECINLLIPRTWCLLQPIQWFLQFEDHAFGLRLVEP